MGCASAFLVIFWTAIIENFVEEEPITYNYFKNAGTGEKYYFKILLSAKVFPSDIKIG